MVATGATEWGKDIAGHPWTIGWQPDYVTEGNAVGSYLKATKPDAKVAVLSQNDAFGEDYLSGFEKAIAGTGIKVVASEDLPGDRPDGGAAGRQAGPHGRRRLPRGHHAQAGGAEHRHGRPLGWKPLHFMSNVSASKTLVFKPVGLTPAKGIISANYTKDPESRSGPRTRPSRSTARS